MVQNVWFTSLNFPNLKTIGHFVLLRILLRICLPQKSHIFRQTTPEIA